MSTGGQNHPLVENHQLNFKSENQSDVNYDSNM